MGSGVECPFGRVAFLGQAGDVFMFVPDEDSQFRTVDTQLETELNPGLKSTPAWVDPDEKFYRALRCDSANAVEGTYLIRLVAKTTKGEKQGFFYYANAAGDPGVMARVDIPSVCVGSSLHVSAWINSMGVYMDDDYENNEPANIGADTVRSHSFVLTNTGTAPLLIAKVYSDCGCTTAEHPEAPVMPGDTARIVVTFNPAGRSAGYFTKLVRVRSNASANPTGCTSRAE